MWPTPCGWPCNASAPVHTTSDTVLDTFIDAERDDYEENTKLFRKSFDIRAWYRES